MSLLYDYMDHQYTMSLLRKAGDSVYLQGLMSSPMDLNISHLTSYSCQIRHIGLICRVETTPRADPKVVSQSTWSFNGGTINIGKIALVPGKMWCLKGDSLSKEGLQHLCCTIDCLQLVVLFLTCVVGVTVKLPVIRPTVPICNHGCR